ILAVLVRTPADGLAPVIDRLLASNDCAQQILALQVALAGGLRVDPGRLATLRNSQAVPVALLARLVAGDTTGDIAPETADLATGEILIETVALAARPAVARLVVSVVRDGPPALRARGLVALAALPRAPDGSATALAETLSADRDPAVRAAALRLLALAPGPGRLARLVAALEDPDRRVRRAAAEALSMLNDEALDALRDTAIDAPDQRWEATVWALEAMQSRPAQRLLRALLAPTLERAAENAALLRQLPAARDPALWRPLDVALADSNQRLVERMLKVLAALPRNRVVVQLRRALASTDLRTRADAIEALASLPDRRLIAAALPLVEAVSLGNVASGSASPVPDRGPLAALVLERAGHSWDVWVRRGAAAVRCTCARGLSEPPAHGFTRVDATEVDMEQLLFLKRIPLFGSLSLDTLLALSRVLATESYVAGETVFADGSPGHCLYLIRSGMLEVRKDQRLLSRLGAGTYVGEMALIDDAPRSASVVVTEDCTLLRLDRAAFEDLTEDYPAMLRELCRMLAFNLREANRRLAVLAPLAE
ncbi:MAG: cyclic nucleotide-binding domain-containing protein, partial [Geminicoccaceae bacterium]